MSALVVLRCDAEDALGPCGEQTSYPAEGRFQNDVALARRTAAREGWSVRDGSDECPIHTQSNKHSVHPNDPPGRRR